MLSIWQASNLQPPDYQSDTHPTEPQRPTPKFLAVPLLFGENTYTPNVKYPFLAVCVPKSKLLVFIPDIVQVLSWIPPLVGLKPFVLKSKSANRTAR